jgi:MFS family permease
VFFVSVPIGVVGTVWSYRSLHETGVHRAARMDWWGNALFGVGLTVLLIGITYGIQPYGGRTMGWLSPLVLGCILSGAVLLLVFCAVEAKVAQPMFHMALFKIRAFWAANLANFLAAVARGGMQFMLIIWLQGIWLPLHGVTFEDTPLWAGIYMVPLTIAFLVTGPLCGALSDRFGARAFASGGLLMIAASFVGFILLPVNFNYWAFTALLVLNGIGSGMYSAPNTTAIMNSVPAGSRGAANGMRGTLQNSGFALSIGVFFSLMVAGLASTLPGAMRTGLMAHHMPAAAASAVADAPPVGSLFAAFLGYNPIQTLAGPQLQSIPAPDRATLTGQTFFPNLIAGPFHHGLAIAFGLAIVMSVIAAVASMLRGTRYIYSDPATEAETASPGTPTSPASPASAPGAATPLTILDVINARDIARSNPDRPPSREPRHRHRSLGRGAG